MTNIFVINNMKQKLL